MPTPTPKKPRRWLRRLLLVLALGTLVGVVLLGVAAICRTWLVERVIAHELARLGLAPTQVGVMALERDHVILGPLVFGDGGPTVASIRVDYTVSGLRAHHLAKVTVHEAHADLQQAADGTWQVRGLDAMQQALARQQAAAPGSASAPAGVPWVVEQVTLQASSVTLHTAHDKKLTVPLTALLTSKDGRAYHAVLDVGLLGDAVGITADFDVPLTAATVSLAAPVLHLDAQQQWLDLLPTALPGELVLTGRCQLFADAQFAPGMWSGSLSVGKLSATLAGNLPPTASTVANGTVHLEADAIDIALQQDGRFSVFATGPEIATVSTARDRGPQDRFHQREGHFYNYVTKVQGRRDPTTGALSWSTATLKMEPIVVDLGGLGHAELHTLDMAATHDAATNTDRATVKLAKGQASLTERGEVSLETLVAELTRDPAAHREQAALTVGRLHASATGQGEGALTDLVVALTHDAAKDATALHGLSGSLKAKLMNATATAGLAVGAADLALTSDGDHHLTLVTSALPLIWQKQISSSLAVSECQVDLAEKAADTSLKVALAVGATTAVTAPVPEGAAVAASGPPAPAWQVAPLAIGVDGTLAKLTLSIPELKSPTFPWLRVHDVAVAATPGAELGVGLTAAATVSPPPIGFYGPSFWVAAGEPVEVKFAAHALRPLGPKPSADLQVDFASKTLSFTRLDWRLAGALRGGLHAEWDGVQVRWSTTTDWETPAVALGPLQLSAPLARLAGSGDFTAHAGAAPLAGPWQGGVALTLADLKAATGDTQVAGQVKLVTSAKGDASSGAAHVEAGLSDIAVQATTGTATGLTFTTTFDTGKVELAALRALPVTGAHGFSGEPWINLPLRGTLALSAAAVTSGPDLAVHDLAVALPFNWSMADGFSATAGSSEPAAGKLSCGPIAWRMFATEPFTWPLTPRGHTLALGGGLKVAESPLAATLSAQVAWVPDLTASGKFAVAPFKIEDLRRLPEVLPGVVGAQLAGEGEMNASFTLVHDIPRAEAQLWWRHGDVVVDDKKFAMHGLDLSVHFANLLRMRTSPAQKLTFKYCTLGPLSFGLVPGALPAAAPVAADTPPPAAASEAAAEPVAPAPALVGPPAPTWVSAEAIAGRAKPVGGTVLFQLESPTSFFIESVALNFMGGQMEANAVRFDPRDPTFRLTLYGDGLQLNSLLKMVDGLDGTADATLYGRLPIIFSKEGIDYRSGFLFIKPGATGHMKLSDLGPLKPYLEQGGSQAATMKLVSDALKDFDLQIFELNFDDDPALDTAMRLRLAGQSASSQIKVPIDFQINVRGDLKRAMNLGLKIAK